TDASMHGLAVGIRRLDRRDDLFFHLGEVVRIDAAFERTGSPQTERVWSFVIVRAGNENIAEVRQMLTDAFDARMKETDEIDGNESDFLPSMLEDNGTGLERIVNAGRLAIVTEPSHEHRFILYARCDVRLGETDLQLDIVGRIRKSKRKKQ